MKLESTCCSADPGLTDHDDFGMLNWQLLMRLLSVDTHAAWHQRSWREITFHSVI